MASPFLLFVFLGRWINWDDPLWGRTNLSYALTCSVVAVLVFWLVGSSTLGRWIGRLLLIAALGFVARGVFFENPDPAWREEFQSWRRDELELKKMENETRAALERTSRTRKEKDAYWARYRERKYEFMTKRGRCVKFDWHPLVSSPAYEEWCPMDHNEGVEGQGDIRSWFVIFPGGCPTNKLFCCLRGGRPQKTFDRDKVRYKCVPKRHLDARPLESSG